MRAAKALLAVVLATGLAWIWLQRDFVVDAYAEPGRDAVDVRLDGLNLTIGLRPLAPSPYTVAAASDTRHVPTALAFSGEDGPDERDAPHPPPSLRGGSARLSGVVTGPDGPLPFATVRIERHTSTGMATADLTTDGLGRWTATRLLGGRYRVRAWLAPELTMTESVVFFLADGQARPVDLQASRVDTEPTMTLVDAGDIYLGLSGTVAVSVTTRAVDDDGVIVVSGLAGAIVTVAPTAEVTATPSIATADGDGVARFVITCAALGSPDLLVQHEDDVRTFDLPDCVPVPQPPAPAEADPGASPGSPAGTGAAPPSGPRGG